MTENSELLYLRKEREKYECDCSETEIRKRKIANGQTRFERQCLKCGKSTGAIKKAMVSYDPPEWDYEKNDGFWKRKSELSRKIFEVMQQERESENKFDREKYHEYLNSTKWAVKRSQVMARSQGLCEGCREAKATEVHHITYEHIFDEFLFELVALCRPCHRRIHPDKQNLSDAA